MIFYLCFRSTTAISYLGFSRFPFYAANRLENNTRTIAALQIILHPDFVSLGDFRYENNIGLIRLAVSVVFTLRIQPALLGTKFAVPGQLGDLVSWFDQYLSHAYVRFAAQPTCSRAFQPDYFPDQESCGGWVNGSLEAVGAPVKQNGVIVAQRTDAPCPRPFHVCDHYAVVVNFAPFLDWISEVTGISVAILTGVIPQIPCCERVEIAQGQIIQSLNNLNVWSQGVSQRYDRRDRALEWFKSGSNSSCFP